MLTHIIWDWNGTLLDDAATCVRALNVLLQRRGLKLETTASYRERFAFPVKRYYEDLGFDFSKEDWDGVAVEYHVVFRRIAVQTRLRAQVRTALRTLRRRGLSLSVLSAAEQSLLEDMLAQRRLRTLFDRVYGLSNMYAHSKFETGRALLRDSGSAPAQTLLVGDTTHDYEVARDLGCRCILLAGGHQAAHRLQACGCEVVAGIGHVLERL